MSPAQPFRLASGGRIDRSKPLTFHFDGKRYGGFEGDTLASALLANGVRVAGRSFRFHRPRGIFASGIEEPNVVVQLGEGALAEPNLKATEVVLRDGLVARAVNAWPSARFDIGAINDLFSPFLAAGFYYKTFMWPRWSWFSGAIRRMGGLGTVPSAPDAASYRQVYSFCDVLVIGGGPAGLSAALAAARSGARVVLAEATVDFGGSLLGADETIDGTQSAVWVERAVAALRAAGNVTLLPATTAFGYYDHNTMNLIDAQQMLHSVRARHVVLATGAFERPLVFRNNDRPNIMLASAARTYLNRYGVAAGRRAVIATNNDSAYPLALELAAHGVTVAAVVDSRNEAPNGFAAALANAGVRLLLGRSPVNAIGRAGVRAVEIAGYDGSSERIACDLLCVSGGWNPVVHLFSQSGGRLRYDDRLQTFVTAAWTQDGTVTGAAVGEFSLAGALRGGAVAGTAAARAAGFAVDDVPTPAVAAEPVQRASRAAWQTPDTGNGRAWVDLLNDVTSRDIRQAADENYRSVEHLKRYTTLGMAVDQGKTSNINAIGVLSDVLEKPIAEIGTTKFRPPFNPVRLGALAAGRTGRFYHPFQQLSAHRAHREATAAMEDYGGWLRPAFYPKPRETEETAVRREVLAVRRSVGVFDASPLGKLRVAGRDAAAFLDRIYVGMMSTLPVGRCRYDLMLYESGIVFDDGVVLRISEHEFLVGTTSAHASAVAFWLEEWLQCEWTSLQVTVEDVTNQWATMTLAGPQALTQLHALCIDAGITDDVLPHMRFCDSTIGEVPCRVTRVSFTGERSYEVSVPSQYGEALWRRCVAAGAVPVGLEAVMRLRLEKGFLHVGSDTDGTTYPQDLGYGTAIANKSTDFIGRRSTMLPEANRSERHQFVGIAPLAPGREIMAGSHLVHNGKSEGWVTSAGFSPVLGRFVALGMIRNGLARIGETVTLQNLGMRTQAQICAPCAYDPGGARLHA
ncbi:MAG TPA: sarcosine oxidase subunit alpha family protein [Rhizomicrobium sp.]